MIKMKIKAFFKYKEYRTYVFEKYFKNEYKKVSLQLVGIIILITLTSIGVKAAQKQTFTSNLYMDNIFKLKDSIGINKKIELIENDSKTQECSTTVQQVSLENKEQTNDQNESKELINKKELEEILQRASQLEEENQKLREDNLNFQNWLKAAASRGTKPQNYRLAPQISSRSGVLRGKYLGQFTVTAYTPSKDECGNNKGITCSGHPIVPGVTVAVDKKYWPIGTVFYIKGLGYVMAMDSGGAIKGRDRLDFAVLDKQFARNIGKRKFDVYLISIGNGKIEDIKF